MTITSGGAARRPILLSTDCGVDMDDQWAIVHLTLIPEIEILGLVTSHAPNLPSPAARESARIAGTVFDAIGAATRPPIYAGSDGPLDGMTPIRNDGVDFLVEQSRTFDRGNRLPVLVLGAATDIASALLVDPSLGDRIEIVAMAFDGWPEGHDGFNVRNDVTAWNVILRSGADVTCGDAASTIRHLALTVDEAERLFGEYGELGRYLVELLRDWLVRNDWMAKDVTGDPASWPVWDQVVVAHLLGLTRWQTYPRPDIRPGPEFVHNRPAAANPTINWIDFIDSKRLWQDLQERLAIWCSG